VSISVTPFIISTNSCIVTFDPQGGSVDPTNKIVEVGIPFGELPTPVRQGYSFLGWYASYSNSAAQVTSNTVVNIRADKKSFAKWQATAITPAGGPTATNIFTVVVTGGEASIQCNDPTVSGAVTIPDRIPNMTNGTPVTAFGSYAFYNKKGITQVSMPLYVAKIPDFAFAYCSALVEVTLLQPFDYRTGQYVSLTIGRAAFGLCNSLKSIIIPACTTNIGSMAFTQCAALTDIYFAGMIPPVVAVDAFVGTASGGVLNIHVPTGAAPNYVGGAWTNVSLRIVEDSNISAMRTALDVSLASVSMEGLQLMVSNTTQPIELGFAVKSTNNLSAAQLMAMLLSSYAGNLRVAYRPTLTAEWQLLVPLFVIDQMNGSAKIMINVPVDAGQGFFKVVIQ
jgi:uncharacterized repeat protein (TIGR02543 family)